MSIDRLAGDLDGVLAGSQRPLEPPRTEPIVLPPEIAAVDVEVLDEHLERFREVFEEAATDGPAPPTLDR